MAEVESDQELIQLLEFDPVVPCACTDATEEDADWYAMCRGCRDVTPMCEPHRLALKKLIEEAPAWVMPQTRCGRRGDTIDDFFEFVPVHP